MMPTMVRETRDSAQEATDRQYNSTLAGKGAYLPDTKAILREIDAGRHPDEVRQAVIEEDLLDQRTRESRKTYWGEVFRRYISGRDPEYVANLARIVARCPNPTVVNLILFYEYCQVDALLYDLTAYFTYELYQAARTAIDKVDVNEWLSRQEAEHPEISRWSPRTRGRLVNGYLSTIRDFGLVRGAKRKEFHKMYVPREAFVYALYHQKDRGFRGKSLIQSIDWRLFLLSESEVVFLLEDAASGGFVHFRHAGNVYDLRFVYEDLSEVVHVITNVVTD
jgi:hypothetical protein